MTVESTEQMFVVKTPDTGMFRSARTSTMSGAKANQHTKAICARGATRSGRRSASRARRFGGGTRRAHEEGGPGEVEGAHVGPLEGEELDLLGLEALGGVDGHGAHLPLAGRRLDGLVRRLGVLDDVAALAGLEGGHGVFR